MTDQIQTPPAPNAAELHAEIERLRTHSAELLADLKAERRAHKDTQAALQNALGGESATWKQRYYQEAVLAPLERELADLTPFPMKYMKDVCTAMGLLKMEADSEGIERPQWLDLEGHPADLTQGLYRFLNGVCDAMPDTELPKVLRGNAASGSGAQQSSSGFVRHAITSEKATPPKAPQARYQLS